MNTKEKKLVVDGLKTIVDMLSDINVGDCAVATTEAVIAGVITRTDALRGYVDSLRAGDGGLRDFCVELCGRLYDHDMHDEEDRLRKLLEETV